MTYDARADLAPMLAEAREKGLWFSCTSFLVGPLYLSPDELKTHLDAGEYHWGPDNWTLVDPADRLRQLDDAVAAAQKERNAFARRMSHAELKYTREY